MEFLGWIIIVAALCMIGLVMYKWHWCMQISKVRSVAKLLKEPGARILLVITGLALIVAASLLVIDW